MRKTILSLIVIAALVIARWMLMRVLERGDLSMTALYRWNKVSGYVVAVLVTLTVGSIWLENLGSWVTYLGLVSAGIVVALSEPVSNIAGWAFILFRRPFGLGDRIEIGSTKGDVVDLGVFVFSLLEVGNWVDADQSTGRVIHVPNAKVFSENVANYTQGFQFIWHEIAVTITFESDWRRAKELIDRIAQEHVMDVAPEAERQLRSAANRFMIAAGTVTPKVYTRVVASGVELTLRFLSEVRQRRSMEEVIWESILDAFGQEPEIELAYPTQRVFFRQPAGTPASE